MDSVVVSQENFQSIFSERSWVRQEALHAPPLGYTTTPSDSQCAWRTHCSLRRTCLFGDYFFTSNSASMASSSVDALAGSSVGAPLA